MTETVSYTLYDEDAEDGERQVTFPAHNEVCSRCRGNGKHVNPSIDGNGLSPDDPDLDEDFWEGYFEGRYDVRCEACNGDRVVMVMNDEESFTPEQKADLALLEKQWEWEARDRAEAEMERRMGA